jgi:hypothetical protein
MIPEIIFSRLGRLQVTVHLPRVVIEERGGSNEKFSTTIAMHALSLLILISAIFAFEKEDFNRVSYRPLKSVKKEDEFRVSGTGLTITVLAEDKLH